MPIHWCMTICPAWTMTICGADSPRCIALRLWQKPATRTLQDHHVVHKTRRNPEVPGSLPMPMPFLNKGDDPATQLDRMWLAHADPLHLAKSGNHKPLNMGILNQMRNDML